MAQSDKGEAAGILSPTVKVLEWDKGGEGAGNLDWQLTGGIWVWRMGWFTISPRQADGPGPSTDCWHCDIHGHGKIGLSQKMLYVEDDACCQQTWLIRLNNIHLRERIKLSVIASEKRLSGSWGKGSTEASRINELHCLVLSFKNISILLLSDLIIGWIEPRRKRVWLHRKMFKI